MSSGRELEAPPDQRVRKFKTGVGELVVWTWDPDYIQHGYLRHWGTLTCAGCKLHENGLEWHVGNKHANQCRQIP